MDTFFKATVRAAIAKGVAALDFVYGRSVWPKRMKLKRFNINSLCNCVLGQVLDNGDDHRLTAIQEFYDAAGIQTNQTYDFEHGFDMTLRFGNGAYTEEPPEAVFKYLQEQWVKVLRKRKGLSAAKPKPKVKRG